MSVTTESKSCLIIDAHLDVAYNAIALERDLTLPIDDLRAREHKAPPIDSQAKGPMVSWPALKLGRVAIIGGSLFVEPARKFSQQVTPCYRTPQEAHAQASRQLDYYRRMSDEQEDIVLVTTRGELDRVWASWQSESPVTGVFIVMEGADPILTPDQVNWWVERGLRGIGLAWSAGSRYAGGNANPGSLTEEGEGLLHIMADYNLLLDISHLWEEAAARVLDRYPGPIVATHANPRALVDAPRMLSDDMIRRVSERGGVIGVVAFNRMLDPYWRLGEPRLPLTRLVEAIDHICQLSGDAAAVGIGSDLDGGFGQASVPEGLDSVADLCKIGDLLRERGYAEGEIAAVLHGNWLRVMREALEAF
jgi:membrane dipeptidase